MNKVVAIDFDGTIAKWAEFPQIGEEVPGSIETITELCSAGHRVILYTVRCGEALDAAVEWLAVRGIEPHGINVRPGQIEYSQSPKVDADIYIDDKALGCPLMFADSAATRPCVDWGLVRSQLRRLLYL